MSTTPKQEKISRFRVKDENGCYKFNYNKESIRQRCFDRVSLPCLKTAIKYGFVKEDMMPIIERYFEILESGYLPSNTQQKNYIKKPLNIDETISEVSESETETDTENDGYSTDASFM